MPSSSTVGIFGGGQLGRMLAQAAPALGVQCRAIDPSPIAPVADVAEHIVGQYEDSASLRAFVEGLTCATTEFENISSKALREVAAYVPVYPPISAIEASQDRVVEKETFVRLGIPTPEFAPIDSVADLERCRSLLSPRAIIKTRRLGYDGKGQRVVSGIEEASRAVQELGGSGLILESFVNFSRELSIIACRGQRDETKFYLVTENLHRGGILRKSIAPAPNLPDELEATAQTYITKLLDHFSYVGVLALELFEVNGQLMANEMAPRVHNTGHWTIEGAETSQFENHLRAVLGMSLGSTKPRAPSIMLNLLTAIPDLSSFADRPGFALHDYRKASAPLRKVGHVTLCDLDVRRLRENSSMIESLLVERIPEPRDK